MGTHKVIVFCLLAAAVVGIVPLASAQVSLVHEGVYAARIDRREASPTGDSALDRDSNGLRIPATAGNTLKFSAWIRRATPTVSTSVQFAGAAFNGPNPATSTHLGNFTGSNFVATADWQEYTFTEVMPAGTTHISIRFGLWTGNGTGIVIDDVSIKDLTAGDDVNILTNPGFEDWSGAADAAPDNWRFFAVNGADGTIERVYEAPTPTPAPPTPTPVSGVDEWAGYE